MRVKHVFLALAIALPISVAVACSGKARTVEIPDAPPGQKAKARPYHPEKETPPGQRREGFLGRMFGSNAPNVGPCPLMGVLYESSRLVDFATAEERYANIRYTGEVRGVRGLCRYVGDDPITMNLEIDMEFGRGPAAQDRRHTYRYWVAVTRRGIVPIEKQYFEVEVEFPRDRSVVTRTEEIERIVIPRATADLSGENFEILVGLDLTPEQLQFNRDGKRFRIDAAAPG
jgi:hypothetical protein